MPTLFTRIIEGEIPGRFVWRDERAVAFLTIAPMAPGHTLVVPIEEVEHWIDLSPDLLQHVMELAQRIGAVLDAEFQPEKVAVIVAGMEVPHVHVHLIPIQSESQLSFANADQDPDPAQLDEIALRISTALNR
jgi:histidine triad (HIT) family protein